MTARVANTPSTDGARITPYGTTSRPGPGASGFETFSWYFFRVSGIGLVVLAILHLVIMHVANDVSTTSYEFIAHRYANPFWRGYDLLLLTLALFHGLNGLRIACDDYIRSRGVRLTVQSVVFITAVGFWLLGSMTIITFQPAAQGTVSPVLRVLFAG